MAKLLKARNPALTDKRSLLLAEVCVHGINTLILLALRSSKSHRQELFNEIEALMRAYLEADLGDGAINNQSTQLLEKLTKVYQLNSRQCLILKYAIDNDKLTIDNCETILSQISRRTVQRDIGKMVKQNLLLPKGNTNNRHYCLNSQMSNL